MWVKKTLTTPYAREARFDPVRRILRIRCATTIIAPAHLKYATVQEREEWTRGDVVVQFSNVDINVIHGMPTGETFVSFIQGKLIGRYPMRRVTVKQFENNLNEND